MSDFDPLAPAPPTAEPMGHPHRSPAGTTPCKKCGRPVDRDSATFSSEGEIICQSCCAVEQVAEGETRVLSALRSGAYGAAAIGLASVCVNPFFLASALAVSGGVGVLTTLARNPHFRAKLGGSYPAVMVSAVLGVVFGLVRPALFLLGIALVAGRPR